jgi:AcrR family transcriptional regulator
VRQEGIAAPTQQRLYDAAVRLFAERGYHGTSLRDIVGTVGVQIAAFYYHFGNKVELLQLMMERTLTDLTADVEAAVAREEVADRKLEAALRAHIAFHANRPLEAFVADSELRALDDGGRDSVLRLRDAYERIFHGILEDGARVRCLAPRDVKVETYALLALATSVATWFRPDGRLGVDEVASIYASLALDGLRPRAAA